MLIAPPADGNVDVSGNPNQRGWLSTVSLLELTSLYQLLLILQTLCTFLYKASYPNKEVNCTEPSALVTAPRMLTLLLALSLGEHCDFRGFGTNIN